MDDKIQNDITDELSVRRERRRNESSTQKSDHTAKIIVAQLIVCAGLVLFVFLLGKSGNSAFNLLKDKYLIFTAKDMSVSEIWRDVKGVAKLALKDDSSGLTSQKVNIEPDKDPLLGRGGDDSQVFAPTSTTLFSPFLISSDICTPVNGKISSGFGYRINPISGIWSFHSGVDIAASQGEKIKAAYYGVVSDTGYNDAAGNYVVLSHGDNLVTKYMHCSQVLVEKDTVVRKGETIALVGSTGNSTGPHLHFMIEINGKKVNPLYALDNDGIFV